MEKEIKRLLRCFKRTELSEQDVADAILKLVESSKVVLPQADVISRLKSIRRFNLANYREGEFGIDTEREYDGNGDYIDSYEIDNIIGELENGL